MLIRLEILLLLYFRILHVSSELWNGPSRHSDVLRTFQEVQKGCSSLLSAEDWNELASPDSTDSSELRSACTWIAKFQAGADVGDDVPLHLEPRYLSEDPDVLWLGDSEEGHYPWLLYLLVGLVCLVVIILWEHLWLKSTLFRVRCAAAKGIDLKVSAPKKVEVGSINLDKAKFWSIVEKKCSAVNSESVPQSHSMLRFTSRVYYGHVQDGHATIWVERVGSCDSEVKVMVRTVNRDSTDLAAQAGSDYMDTEKEVVFAPGAKRASIDVQIFGKYAWQSSMWFQVHLGPITSGDAQLQPQKHTRCFVVDDRRYPGLIPKQVLERKGNFGLRRFRIAYYFMMECIDLRGIKFWKTLIAMMYPPVHDVIVQYMVQKIIISYVVLKEFSSTTYEGAMTEILLLAAVHFLSVCIYRWSVVVQTKNRGRTGGIRQTHRLHLLEKMLLCDHHAHMAHKGSHWLYAAIHDVDRITVDVYWNFFVAVQNIESMMLSFLLIIFWDLYKIQRKGEEYDIAKLLPSISFIVFIPVCTFLIWRRRHAVATFIQARKDQEAEWMDIFSWMSEVGHFMYGFGYRELAKIEGKFKSDNKEFVSVHQKQRDIMSDSVAIAMWVSTVAYLLILVWGGFGLLADKDGNTAQHAIDSGSYVLLLGLFSKFGKYITKLNNCVVNFSRGSVSLEHIIDLLNTPDHAEKAQKHGLKQQEDIPEDRLLLRSACLEISDKAFGIGPFGAVRTKPGSEIQIPLGKMVCVKSVHEARLLGLFAMAAGVVPPTSGTVCCPHYLRRIMLPTQPVHSIGELTCIEELLTTGVTPRQGAYLLKCLNIDPDHGSRHLAPGQIQLLVLLRALLRDPEILVLACPLAFVGERTQKRAIMLLRVWQAYGGAAGLLRLCEEAKTAKEGNDNRLDTPALAHHNSELPLEDIMALENQVTSSTATSDHLEEGGPIPQRTVIVTFADVNIHGTGDVILDLDEFLVDDDDTKLCDESAAPEDYPNESTAL